MKKGQILEGIVERVDFPNKGIVRTEEGTVMVKNAFPGQKIRFAITKKRSGRAEGRLLEVLQVSRLEMRSPACGCFPNCGGCTWQTMNYKEQLAMKADQVKRLLNPVFCSAGLEDWCELSYRDLKTIEDRSECDATGAKTEKNEDNKNKTVIFEGIHRSPKEFAYRNKMEFSFGDSYKDGPLCLGLHKCGSRYDVLTTSDCRLVHPDMTAILTATLEFFREKQIPYYHKMTHTGILRHLLLRRAEKTGEILVCLVTVGEREEKPEETNKEQIIERIIEKTEGTNEEKEEEKSEEKNNEKNKENNEVSAEDAFVKIDEAEITGTEKKFGSLTELTEITEIWQEYAARILSLQLEGHVTGILHMLNNSVADIVQSEQTTVLYGKDYFYETLLGLHFKITPFSFFQTNSLGAEVLYSTAREYIGNTKAATLFDLYSGTGTIAQILSPVAEKVIGVEIVEEAVEAARENARMNGLDNCTFLAGDVLKVLDTITDRPDFIVLDPPRDGIHPKALKKIIDYGAPNILYISCKPTSLARDLEVLLANGYQAERICCVDMFPQTANVETVCLLHKPF
ncbi:MAG: 23S rRNA (uracil(1939)-C(5))-methyltransferase RlmD [Clostridiales bacterium]|nr:23S rRNA (uracil(1939)-C(5))-methyltransferase RlmD [Clostridiales bacterium]